MGADADRRDFVGTFNDAFSADRIESTLTQLGPLVFSMDAIEIIHRARLAPWLRAETFFNYRDSVGIPAVNMRVATAALHGALMHRPHPMPVVLEIAEGPAEAITVTQLPGQLTITLIRSTPQAVPAGGD